MPSDTLHNMYSLDVLPAIKLYVDVFTPFINSKSSGAIIITLNIPINRRDYSLRCKHLQRGSSYFPKVKNLYLPITEKLDAGCLANKFNSSSAVYLGSCIKYIDSPFEPQAERILAPNKRNTLNIPIKNFFIIPPRLISVFFKIIKHKFLKACLKIDTLCFNYNFYKLFCQINYGNILIY